jgi:hypothetical protein
MVQVGMKVEVKGGFGTEKPEIVTVEELGSKNDRPLFFYTDKDNTPRWAYKTQIIRVVEEKSLKTIKELTSELPEDASINQILELTKDLPPIEIKLCPYCHKTNDDCICI